MSNPALYLVTALLYAGLGIYFWRRIWRNHGTTDEAKATHIMERAAIEADYYSAKVTGNDPLFIHLDKSHSAPPGLAYFSVIPIPFFSRRVESGSGECRILHLLANAANLLAGQLSL